MVEPRYPLPKQMHAVKRYCIRESYEELISYRCVQKIWTFRYSDGTTETVKIVDILC